MGYIRFISRFALFMAERRKKHPIAYANSQVSTKILIAHSEFTGFENNDRVYCLSCSAQRVANPIVAMPFIACIIAFASAVLHKKGSYDTCMPDDLTLSRTMWIYQLSLLFRYFVAPLFISRFRSESIYECHVMIWRFFGLWASLLVDTRILTTCDVVEF